ncbi:MAG: hypothetical protein ACFB0Z_04935 [Candidatus Phaeomarinobacter sp.]
MAKRPEDAGPTETAETVEQGETLNVIAFAPTEKKTMDLPEGHSADVITLHAPAEGVNSQVVAGKT